MKPEEKEVCHVKQSDYPGFYNALDLHKSNLSYEEITRRTRNRFLESY